MNVIARIDPHAAHQDICEAHPNWIAVDAAGNKRRHWSDLELWVTCSLGLYNFDFTTRVKRSLGSMAWIKFSQTAGQALGCAITNTVERTSRLLRRWNCPAPVIRRTQAVALTCRHQQRLFELWRLWDTKIKAINPNAAYLANAGGGALSDLDMTVIGQLAPTLFADRQARPWREPSLDQWQDGKEYRATVGRKPIAGMCSVGLEEEYRWKDSVQSADEIRLWVADGIAQGLRPWFTKFNAKPIY